MKKEIKKIKLFTFIFLIFTITTIAFSNNFCILKAEENNINLVKYTGKIETLAFTTLMSFPEKALHENNSYSNIYDESKLTVNEFENILEELYQNNYVLIDIYDIVDKEQIYKKEIYLPQGKKPLLLTFDNVTYKSNYQNLGQIDKIIIDRNNNLASYTTKKSIQDRIQYNNEFQLILENFIKKHKDFAINGAKGIIFLTGENGILGYNTNHKNASSKYEKKRVSEVIRKLKNLGWRFGSNNYTYKDETIKSDLEFAKELSLWNNEVKDIIGESNLYAFPYGNYNENCNQKLELLMANNFKIFFVNSDKSSINFYSGICFVNRKEVNGKSLRETPEQFENLFDANKVYDHTNRTIKYKN